MTEPEVASSDATNMQARIERDGDEYVINGHKWWTSGAASERCKISIFMGVTDPEAEPHRQHSMILVPLDTPGVSIGTRIMLCCRYGSASGSVTPIRIAILQRSLAAPLVHHL